MELEEVLEYLDVPFTFSKRPSPLHPQLRVAWGISILILILYVSSRGKKSSVSRLQVINWSLKSRENCHRLIEIMVNRRSPFVNLVQYDPSFNRALEYAKAENLVEMNNNAKIHLTKKGEQLAKEILDLEECLSNEKQILFELGTSVTEKLSDTILRKSS